MVQFSSEKLFVILLILTAGSALIVIFLMLSIIKNIRSKEAAQKKMLHTIIETQEKERYRIASDLHDNFGGFINSIKLETQAITKSNNLVFIQESISAIENSIFQIKIDMNEMVANLTSHKLLEKGLLLALAEIKTNYEKIGLKINIAHYGQVAALNDSSLQNVFRIFQELLNNTCKHANAQEIFITIYFKENTIQIEYDDDGCGFDINSIALKQGFGLKSLNARIKMMNGTYKLESNNEGTSYLIELKIKS